MTAWISLELLNGWVADENNPPRYRVDGGLITVVGAAMPTEDPEKPVARFPENLWPLTTISEEEEIGGVLCGWSVDTEGYLYVYQHHILEFM